MLSYLISIYYFPYLNVLTTIIGQLQKMGILKPKSQDKESSARRRSLQPDFSNLAPLKPGGTIGFLNFRDNNNRISGAKSKRDNESDMDSEDEDDPLVGKAEDEEVKDTQTHLSPDDIRRQAELAEGVRKIKVRMKWPLEVWQYSNEPASSNDSILLSH
jgi:hypothetical protein